MAGQYLPLLDPPGTTRLEVIRVNLATIQGIPTPPVGVNTPCMDCGFAVGLHMPGMGCRISLGIRNIG